MDYNIHDAILSPVTFSDISLILRNTRPEDRGFFINEVREMLLDKIDEAIELVEDNFGMIWNDAFCDEDEKVLNNAPGWDLAKLSSLAKDIYECLLKHGAWIDVCIYYDECRMSTSSTIDGRIEFRYNGAPFIEVGYDPREYFDYVANPHILSMSFEGPFYDAINYGRNQQLIEDFENILRDYGVYYKLGDAWNLTLFEE